MGHYTIKEDSKAEIEMCLNCPYPVCTDCLSVAKRHTTKHSFAETPRFIKDTSRLTDRCLKIYEQYLEGHNDPEISDILGIGRVTVRYERIKLGLPAYPHVSFDERKQLIKLWYSEWQTA